MSSFWGLSCSLFRGTNCLHNTGRARVAQAAGGHAPQCHTPPSTSRESASHESRQALCRTRAPKGHRRGCHCLGRAGWDGQRDAAEDRTWAEHQAPLHAGPQNCRETRQRATPQAMGKEQSAHGPLSLLPRGRTQCGEGVWGWGKLGGAENVAGNQRAPMAGCGPAPGLSHLTLEVSTSPSHLYI